MHPFKKTAVSILMTLALVLPATVVRADSPDFVDSLFAALAKTQDVMDQAEDSMKQIEITTEGVSVRVKQLEDEFASKDRDVPTIARSLEILSRMLKEAEVAAEDVTIDLAASERTLHKLYDIAVATRSKQLAVAVRKTLQHLTALQSRSTKCGSLMKETRDRITRLSEAIEREGA